MQAIDPATLMLAAAMTGFLSGAFSLMAAKAFAGVGASARDWGHGTLTLGCAALLWFLTPPLPHWVGFVLGNSMVVLTPVFLLRAIYCYEGDRLHKTTTSLMLALGLGSIFSAQWAEAPTTLAVAGIALAHLMFSVLGGWRLYWQGRRSGSVYCLVIFMVLVIVGLATLARLMVLLFGEGAAAVAPVANSKTQIAAIAVITLLVIAGTFGFLGMVAERSRALILENANRDALTGVLTRGAFYEQAERLLSKTEAPLVLLMLDIDHFKRINDTHGHPTGDAVIRHAARLIQRNSRTNDLVGRYGGEEFCVLLPSCGLVEGRRIAERFVQEAAQQPARVASGEPLPWTLSVGYVAAVKTEGKNELFRLDTLIAAADAALYEAKRQGRNRAIQASQAELDSLVRQHARLPAGQQA
ncbi:GGDEF domain-containing protein [Hydrogenophaga atypica]|uniref:diguanylate cyclase n=1 Tax=Hydrogenophaga atypica TaxID=249409 RepID=A0ABW2QQ42_9BURK